MAVTISLHLREDWLHILFEDACFMNSDQPHDHTSASYICDMLASLHSSRQVAVAAA